jgi:hypothetical protein
MRMMDGEYTFRGDLIRPRYTEFLASATSGKESLGKTRMVEKSGARHPYIYGFMRPMPDSAATTIGVRKEVIMHNRLLHILWNLFSNGA